MIASSSAPGSRPLVVGNWKMCAGRAELAEIRAISQAAARSEADIVLCPSFPLIQSARRAVRGVEVGAQDCHHMMEGAFTGAVSPLLLRDIGARYVIVGHSERRAIGETDALVCAKASSALGADLIPIICVGESASERDAGMAEVVIGDQVEASLPAVASPEKLVLAYEPIWAIGSGRTPTAAEIAATHAAIRRTLLRAYGETGAAVRILYGGSVNPANAGWISAIPDVDGLLVGTCSLHARDFVPIIEAACAPPSRDQAVAA